MKPFVFGCAIFLLALLQAVPAKCQGIEIGLMAGVANYYGDINPDFSFDYLRPSGSFFIKQHLNQYISYKGSIGYGRVGGSDQQHSQVFQETRNLSFQSDIFELSAQVELNFFRYEPQNLNHFFTPYLTTGVAAFRFNPKTELDGEMIELQPIGTEGQANPDISNKLPYNLTQFSIPMGLGIKYWVFGNWTIGGEITYRKTFTDYIDDVSDAYVEDFILGPLARELSDKSTDEPNTLGTPSKQRGNSINTDDYLFGGVFITHTFNRSKCPSATKGTNASLRKRR